MEKRAYLASPSLAKYSLSLLDDQFDAVAGMLVSALV
jgi:hypothetical protein